jgi:hypothetical protein
VTTGSSLIAELGTYLIRLGMVQLGEDDHGLLPDVLGGVQVAESLMGVAEIHKGRGLVLAVPVLLEYLESSLVLGDRLLVIAELVVDVAEAVQYVGLPVPVAELQKYGQCLVAVLPGGPVVPEVGEQTADAVADVGLTGLMIHCSELAESVLGVHQRLSVPALPLQQVGDAVRGMRLTDMILEVTEEVPGPSNVGVGGLVVTQPSLGTSEAVQRMGLPGQVIRSPRRRERRVLGGEVVLPAAGALEVQHHGPGQSPCVGFEPCLGRPFDGRA